LKIREYSLNETPTAFRKIPNRSVDAGKKGMKKKRIPVPLSHLFLNSRGNIIKKNVLLHDFLKKRGRYSLSIALDHPSLCVHSDCCVARERSAWDLSELFGSGLSFGWLFCTLALTRISVILSPSRTALHLDIAHLL
jgi:hypothetical protein